MMRPSTGDKTDDAQDPRADETFRRRGGDIEFGHFAGFMISERDKTLNMNDRSSADTRWIAKGRLSTYGFLFREDGDPLRDGEMYLYWAGGCSLEP